jgi:hypothetical protein
MSSSAYYSTSMQWRDRPDELRVWAGLFYLYISVAYNKAHMQKKHGFEVVTTVIRLV